MAAKKVRSDKEKIISYLTLRKAIGWLGMLLPFTLIIGTFFISKLDILNNTFFINSSCSQPFYAGSSLKVSISNYYYSVTGELFTAILCSVALFLLCYKGHPIRKFDKGLSDDAISNLLGISALGVVIFPTDAAECINDSVRTFLISKSAGYFHYIFAAMFFILLSVMLLSNFRRGFKKSDFGKGKDHGLYLFCGIGILVCIGLIFIYRVCLVGLCEGLDNLQPLFWLETVALIFFGISWLKKGRADFCYIPKLLNLCK